MISLDNASAISAELWFCSEHCCMDTRYNIVLVLGNMFYDAIKVFCESVNDGPSNVFEPFQM